MNNEQLLSSYDYNLPSELIAQTPVTPRHNSRLLVVNSPTTHTHSIFRELPKWLSAGDLLVFNDTRVIPARLHGRKSTGAPVEVLLLEQKSDNCWLALVKPGRRFKLGSQIIFADNTVQLEATVKGRDEATGGRFLQFHIPPHLSFWDLLAQLGEIPFPPYVSASEARPEQYQTIFARYPGAVAAPTAGLHFTGELLHSLQEKGIERAYITLHVGLGTFRPVEIEDITQHSMHEEWVEVPQDTVEQIQATKARGGRVLAVGTTVVRALEASARATAETGSGDKLLLPFRGKTDLFIYPGYRWRVVDGMITNFHLPRSSLLMLVSSLIGRERLLSLYQEAIREKYRFYSFGDAMLIVNYPN